MQEMTETEKQIMDAAMQGVRPPTDRKPVALVMWGGIGADKTTASSAVFKELGMDRANTVDVDVDGLVLQVPEFLSAIETDMELMAYMKCRNDAKKVQKPLALEALERGLDVYVEWANEDNLHALSRGSSDLFKNAMLEDKGYTVVLCLVECRDVEGILQVTKEREKVDGWHIPEDVIRKYNTDRAKHWFTAVKTLQGGSLRVRAFVETFLSASANAKGLGLVELTGRDKASTSIRGIGDGDFPDEAAAQAAVNTLRKTNPIRKYNTDRVTHWFTAVKPLQGGSLGVRARIRGIGAGDLPDEVDQAAVDALRKTNPEQERLETFDKYSERLERLLQESSKYSLLVLKATAGFLKFVLEDILNAVAQWLFAVKYWHELTITMQIFTLGSLAAGLLVSIFGPIRDVRAALGMRSRAREDGEDPAQLAVDPEIYARELGEHLAASLPKELESGTEDSPGKGSEDSPGKGSEDSPGKGSVDLPGKGSEDSPGKGSVAPSAALGAEESGIVQPLIGTKKRRASQATVMRAIMVPGVSMVNFVGSGLPNGTIAHYLLVASALMYWGGMALIPLFFGGGIKGGVKAAVPVSAALYFTILAGCSLLVELWIANQTYEGQMLFRKFPQVLGGVCEDRSKAMPIAGILLSILARYDTFCDMVFTVVLYKTPAITEIRFETFVQKTISLPFEVFHLALFSLIVGVFCAQGLPGLLLMFSKKHLGTAFKLNEFCVLLGVMEMELQADSGAAGASGPVHGALLAQ